MYSPCVTGVHKGLLCTQVADVTNFLLQHFNLMYAYNAMASYFARDNVALLGFSKVRSNGGLGLKVFLNPARSSCACNSPHATVLALFTRYDCRALRYVEASLLWITSRTTRSPQQPPCHKSSPSIAFVSTLPQVTTTTILTRYFSPGLRGLTRHLAVRDAAVPELRQPAVWARAGLPGLPGVPLLALRASAVHERRRMPFDSPLLRSHSAVVRVLGSCVWTQDMQGLLV